MKSTNWWSDAIVDIYGSLRQWRYSRPFRIPRPPSYATLLEQGLALATSAGAQASTGSDANERTQDPDSERVLVRLSVGLWRLRTQLVDAGTGQPFEGTRRAYRHLQSLWSTLEEAGVEIRDHTGEPFDAGMSLSVVAYEPTPGIVREVVKETIKPTVYLRDRRVQRGEVIVSTPQDDGLVR